MFSTVAKKDLRVRTIANNLTVESFSSRANIKILAMRKVSPDASDVELPLAAESTDLSGRQVALPRSGQAANEFGHRRLSPCHTHKVGAGEWFEVDPLPIGRATVGAVRGGGGCVGRILWGGVLCRGAPRDSADEGFRSVKLILRQASRSKANGGEKVGCL